MKTLKYIALAVLTISFAACEQEEFTPSVQNDPDAVRISATIGALQTRVSYDDNGVTNFTNGDAIKVTNTMRASKSEATYTTTDGVSWITTDAFVWNGGIMYNQFRAWYPATASYEKFTLPNNQSTDTENADWMTASTDEIIKPDDCVLNLNFQHRLAKVTVKITKWNNEFEGTEEITEPKIYTNGTDVTADYENGSATITATGVNTGIAPLVNGTSFTAIVAPVKYAITDKFMTFTVAGEDMTVFAKTSALTNGLQPGNHYTFSLTVGKDAVTIKSVSVTKWNEQDLNGGVAKEVTP